MSETKHTPGPWRDSAPDVGGVDQNYRQIDAGKGFFDTGNPNTDLGFSLVGFISAANARLIAAAPELLAALKSVEVFVAEELDCRKRSMDEGDEYVTAASEALSTVHAAIEKAEGRAK